MLTLKPLFKPKPSRIELRARLRAASTVFYQRCLPSCFCFPSSCLWGACFVLFCFVSLCLGPWWVTKHIVMKEKVLEVFQLKNPHPVLDIFLSRQEDLFRQEKATSHHQAWRQNRLHPRLFWLPELLNGRTKGCGLKIECQHCLRAKTKHPRILYRGTQSLTMICSRP